MEKMQPTLKDLAQRLNLSVGTVQRALNNKGGYRPETQRRVLEEAEKIGYTVNAAASALRRPPIAIAVVLPEPVGNNKYFYQYVWQGVELACRELAVYQISFQKIFANTHSDDFWDTLNRLSLSGDIQGLITVSNRDARFEAVMLGLRLTDGLPEAAFRASFGVGFREAFGEKLDAPLRDGRLTLDGGVLRLTRRGMDVMNSVLVELL